MTTLTANETAVLNAIAYNFYGDGPGSDIWADSINDSSKPSGLSGNVLSGTVSSLSQKGLISCHGHGRDACIRILAAGVILTQS